MQAKQILSKQDLSDKRKLFIKRFNKAEKQLANAQAKFEFSTIRIAPFGFDDLKNTVMAQN